MADHDTHAHAGPSFQSYVTIFLILCVLTAASFVVNAALGQNGTSASIIMGVAVVKAACVIMVFMHLYYDWRTVYCIMVPVCIMAVMTILVLLPDTVFGWANFRGILFGIGE